MRLTLTLAVAEALRRELESLVREVSGPAHGVEGCCTVASLALAEVLRERGVAAELAYGTFRCDGFKEPHTWCLIPSGDAYQYDRSWVHHAAVLDVTADQFLLAGVPSVALLPPGDPARGCYAVEEVGVEAEAELQLSTPEDAGYAGVLAARTRLRLMAIPPRPPRRM